MPSSLPLSRIVNNRFSRRFRVPHATGVFTKISLEKAFDLLGRADIDAADFRRLTFRLKKQAQADGLNGTFSLKDVPNVFRHYLPPLTMNADALPLASPQRILLVDDLLSTETTMLTAAGLLRQHYPQGIVTGACLFGSAGR